MKLSKRLIQIDKMVATHYSHIWDCCCDHGYLGAALLDRQAAKDIHFVDIVPKLMQELAAKLEQFHSSGQVRAHTHCQDVAAIPLGQYSGRQLIIIAGVGGDLMIRFITCLLDQHPTISLDFLLCPVHHQYALREALIERDLRLTSEALVEDNQRFYEVLLVSTDRTNASRKVSNVGSDIWVSNSEEKALCAQHYLTKTINHYKRIAKGKNDNIQPIINAYQAVTISRLT
ncbi:tRNA (adenine(22)-N(1))-methyltransferase TrmK [Vibrio sp. 10N.261.51.F12]|uniref:tRNA (adenine(22)-N(1))-methyltransferase n=1 Tax=Vibrio sp. 10N.261.51.F12 TaxID=3229679 RepID=UPI00354DA9BE